MKYNLLKGDVPVDIEIQSKIGAHPGVEIRVAEFGALPGPLEMGVEADPQEAAGHLVGKLRIVAGGGLSRINDMRITSPGVIRNLNDHLGMWQAQRLVHLSKPS